MIGKHFIEIEISIALHHVFSLGIPVAGVAGCDRSEFCFLRCF